MEPVQYGDTWAERWPGIATDQDLRNEMKRRREVLGINTPVAGKLVNKSPTWVSGFESGSTWDHPWPSTVFNYMRYLGFSRQDVLLAMVEFGFMPTTYSTASYLISAISSDSDDDARAARVEAVIADHEKELEIRKAERVERTRFKRDIVLLEVEGYAAMYPGEVFKGSAMAAAQAIHAKRHGNNVPGVSMYAKAVSRYRSGERFAWRVYRCSWLRKPRFWSDAEYTLEMGMLAMKDGFVPEQPDCGCERNDGVIGDVSDGPEMFLGGE